ncbi:Acyl-CoA dehydrogenase family member 10 [Nymphon striatum]|nr:Acyl-CoA dehydrogenase family member 10 [Nymphon striatum]
MQFIAENVLPIEKEVDAFHHDPANAWKKWPGLEGLKQKAKDAEIMGRGIWFSEIFNCSPPDTGNMEVLAKYGSPEHQDKWLKPLMNGEIRSAFLMTEPEVASSDAT